MTRNQLVAGIVGGLFVVGGCGAGPPVEEPPVAAAPQAAPASGPGNMPPAREDLTLSGRILEYQERTGEELDMEPADMTIYLYRFRVERPGDSKLERGEEIRLRSKLAPPDDWRSHSLNVRVASYASGKTYWLVAFKGSPAP